VRRLRRFSVADVLENIFQSLACGRLACVAAARPAAAVLTKPKQSVTIEGSCGFSLATVMSAQASAPAASWTHAGGEPYPYPTSWPTSVVTTMPNPSLVVYQLGPSTAEPSMYHLRFFVPSSSGRMPQRNQPCSLGA